MSPWTPLLAAWFGEPTDDLTRARRQSPLWWGKSEETDAWLRGEFGTLAADAAAGRLDEWAHSPQGRLALILLLDQLPRNLHRGSDAAFAQDARARELCLEGLASGADQSLSALERVFFYLPLEHAESLPLQDRCVALFEALAREQGPGLFDEYLDFARRHQAIIARFGRFPHRNAVLGRESSEAERSFLTQPGSSF